MVDRHGDDWLSGKHFDRVNLLIQRVQGMVRKAVVVRPRRCVLKHDDVRSSGSQEFHAARVGGVHEAPLALEHHDLGASLVPAAPDRVFDLAGHEVVDERIEDDPIPSALHPRRLTGSDQLSLVPGRTESIHENPSRGAFAYRRVRAEQCDAQRTDFRDLLAIEEVQRATGRRFTNVPNRYSMLAGQRDHFGILGQEVVKARIDVEPTSNRLQHSVARQGVEPSAVRRKAHDKVRRRIARQRLAETTDHWNACDCAVENLASVAAVVSGINDGDHVVSPTTTHETVCGLAVGRAECTFTVNDCSTFGCLVHDLRPVRMAT
jgi:hypothetical protein